MCVAPEMASISLWAMLKMKANEAKEKGKQYKLIMAGKPSN